jgi:hypothetical protein
MTDGTIKYCTGCIHIVRPNGCGLTDARCDVPRNGLGAGVKYIDPSLDAPLRFCRVERGNDDSDSCGPDGKWYEPAWEEAEGFFPIHVRDGIVNKSGKYRVVYNRGLRFEAFDTPEQADTLLRRLQNEGGSH